VAGLDAVSVQMFRTFLLMPYGWISGACSIT
jgi:hypothetical protein